MASSIPVQRKQGGKYKSSSSNSKRGKAKIRGHHKMMRRDRADSRKSRDLTAAAIILMFTLIVQHALIHGGSSIPMLAVTVRDKHGSQT